MTLGIQLTPTQQRIYDVLKDGECHKPIELLMAVDEQADSNNLRQHISILRGRLYEEGLLIAAHSAGKAGVSSYQLVQRLRVRLD